MILAALITLMVLCFYQDVRFRGIHWVVFPLILGAAIMLRFDSLDGITILLNLAFLAVLLLSLTLYLTLKHGRLINITKGFFSWGDILFLVAIIPLFSGPWYMYFFIAGTMLALVFHLIASLIKPQKSIPYAGYMAVLGIIYLVFQEPIQTLVQLN